ncbi:hypothetical protein BX616_006824 [Lobosporangium transversale]|nr:hypothetical protein BX616_006824 [Lobosporangium transversale]
MHCTCHRVFLASLIVAAKYLNDQSPKNKHWSTHSAVFSVGEVNLMEKQLLSLLDFDLRITEADLASSLHDFLQQQQKSNISAVFGPSSDLSNQKNGRYALPTAISTSTAQKVPSSSLITPSTPSPRNSFVPHSLPQQCSNKRGSVGASKSTPVNIQQSRSQLHMLQQQPHDAFRRRPSLPNQPSLEDDEVLPVYKRPLRSHQSHQSHYPSPDSGSEVLLHTSSASGTTQSIRDEDMTTSSFSSPESTHGSVAPPPAKRASWGSGAPYGRHSMPPPTVSLAFASQEHVHPHHSFNLAHHHAHPHAQPYHAHHAHHPHHHKVVGHNGGWTGPSSRAMC